MAPIIITAGPSKWDLMLSLFEGKKVTFQVKKTDGSSCPKEVAGWIDRVYAEDRANDFWHIEGHLVGGVEFRARYSTRSRQGGMSTK